MKAFNNTRLEIRYILDHLINAVQPNDVESIVKIAVPENTKNVSAYCVVYRNINNKPIVTYSVLWKITNKYYMATFKNAIDAAEFYNNQLSK